MHTWTLSLRASADSGLPSVDVEVRARDEATVADLARALGQHLAPDQRRLDVVPMSGTQPWPAERPLAECGLRTGDLLDVTTASASWRETRAGGARPRAVLRVVEGPDRGTQVQVRGSAVTVGRGQHCTLRLTDPLVSHHHARVVLGARPTVHDEGSANGTSIEGEPITSPREVDWGKTFRLGHTTVAVDLGQVAPQDSPVSVFRPPRFGEPLAEGTLEVDAPPERRRPSPLPWAMFALPVVMGLAMFMRSQTPYSLVYMLAWPLVGWFGWRQQRRQAEREFQEDLAVWRADVDDTLATLDARASEQRRQQHDDHPGFDVVRDRVVQRDPYLWARRGDRTGFLQTRVGIGPVPALLRGSIKDGGDRDARRECATELAARDVLATMPVLAPVAEHTLIAVTGAADAVDAFARALVVRLAYDHSPNDLTFAGCLSRGRSEHESWLRWLPHTAVRLGGEQPVAFGSHHGAALLEHLLVEDDATHTVCLVDAEAGIPRRNVEAAAAAAAARNLHLVWLGRDRAEVPANTTVLVDLEPGGRATVSVSDRGGVARVDAVDQVSLADAWRVARLMTGYVDEAAVLPPSTAIPSLVRLSDMSSDFEDLDDAEAVGHRWAQSAGLRAQIGTGADGVVTIDLREDGPHGLVAGTTGSGKSELLQSLICSLALNNPPSRINFLLVDYKGGAAFRECGDLPHTVGYITDLTPALVSRALTSLGAEITAREHLLGEYGVKDLVQLERERPDVAPPSLLICVDEFAALTSEVPEFVDGMVNIAQRGRSLGMHVILATQRPAGVVTGNIRANTDLRIALRVSSREDSDDVIDSPEAARIPRRTPGRAWIRRTGHGTAEMVQSAWTGARQPLAGSEAPVVVRPFSAAGGDASGAPSTGTPARLHPHTDLERCVATISSAFELSGVPAPARPWLPPLPGELLLDADHVVAGARTRRPGRVHLGRIDEPEAQAQPDLVVDFAVVGHLLVHGASGSGKTELLRTMVLSASLGDASCADGLAPYVYGIDFAGGGLAAIADLPTVEAVVPQAHPGRVQRLIRLLKRTMTERTQLLAARGCADLDELATAGQRLPRVYVVVDNLPALVESLESAGGVAREHVEQLQEVLQNGRRVGVHVVATAPGRGGVPGALGSAFGQRVVLRMNASDDYLMLGVPGTVLDADSAAGAGLLGKRSIQVSTTGGAGTPDQGVRIARWGELLTPATAGRTPAPVPAMPTRLDSRALPAPTGSRVPIGVDAAAAAVIETDLRAGPVLIAGRAGSGRTSALDGIAALVARGDEPPYVVREDTAAKAAELVRSWLEDAAGADRPEGSGSWCLLMVDDAEVWDTEAGVDEGSRAARDEVMAAMSAHRDRLAVVAAADMGQARARSIGPTLVDAVRQGRRGFLLQPEWNDGEVLGVTVPTKTTEPLSGTGRGLWCQGGSTTVAQLVTQVAQAPSSPGPTDPPTTAVPTDERGVR